MNDSPPQEKTFDEMVEAAKSQIERERLYRRTIKSDPELLNRQEQGSVIEQQAQRIEALTAALHTSLVWCDELVKERDAKIKRFKELVSFADYWTVMNEEGGE